MDNTDKALKTNCRAYQRPPGPIVDQTPVPIFIPTMAKNNTSSKAHCRGQQTQTPIPTSVPTMAKNNTSSKASCRGQQTKTQHSNSWKKDVVLLACILRLRVVPPVPFGEIAALVLESFAKDVLDEYRNVVLSSRGYGGDNDSIEMWLETSLEVGVMQAETRNEDEDETAWTLAERWADNGVGEIMRICGLLDRGYGVLNLFETWELERWKREKDWKAGSVVLGRAERLTGSDVESGVYVVGNRRGENPETILETQWDMLDQVRKAVAEIRTNSTSLLEIQKEQHQAATEAQAETFRAPRPSTTPQQETLEAQPKIVLAPRPSTTQQQYQQQQSFNPPPAQRSTLPVLSDYERQQEQNMRELQLRAMQSMQPARGIRTTLINPLTGRNVIFNAPHNSRMSFQPTTTLPDLPLEHSMHNHWQSFSNQLEEIRAMEDQIRSRLQQPQNDHSKVLNWDDGNASGWLIGED